MAEPSQMLLYDQYDTALHSNVRPPEWTNPEPVRRYDLVVLGAGAAGLAAAAGAAGVGAKVALVESNVLGGDSLNRGSVPSQSLIRSARAYSDVRTAARYGLRIGELIAEDFPAAMTRLRKVRSHLSVHHSVRRLRGAGVDVFFGHGRFVSPDRVEVAGKVLRFVRALVATGSRPIVPSIEGLGRVGYLTTDTVFALPQLPRRLAVIGAGPAGCELAQAFCRLGSDVTLIERETRILPGEDIDACRVLSNAFRRDDVTVKMGAIVTHVRGGESAKTLHLRTGSQAEQVTVDEILLCTGRAANTDSLDLPAGGVASDALRGVLVDDYLRTSNPRVYAAGDVCTRHRYAHVAEATARIALHNALLAGWRRMSDLVIPWCTHTDPEVARVGLSADEAQRRGVELETFAVPFHAVDRAVIDGDEEGLLKVHVRKGTDRLAGAMVISRQAGDMISEITLAMVHRIGLGGIAEVIHPYATHAEAIRQAADAYRRTRLTPTLRRLLRRWLAWRW